MPIVVIHGTIHIRERGKYREAWIYIPTEDIPKIEKFNKMKVHLLVIVDDI